MKRHIADKEGTRWFSSYQYRDEEEERRRRRKAFSWLVEIRPTCN
jgi:hypothetical protein